MQGKEEYIKKKADDFEGQFHYKQGIIYLSLKSAKRAMILFANFAQDNMPTTLQNVINTPQQLFQVLAKMDQKNLSISEKDELVMTMSMFGLQRKYYLPLQKTDLSNEQKLAYQVIVLKEQLAKMHNKMSEVDQVSMQKLQFSKQVIANLKSKMQKLQDENMALKAYIEQSKNKTIICPSDDPFNKQKKIAALQQQLEHYREKLDKEQMTIQAMQQQMKCLQQQLKMMQQKIMYKQKQGYCLKQKMICLQDQCKLLLDENKKMKMGLADGTISAGHSTQKNDTKEQLQSSLLKIQQLQNMIQSLTMQNCMLKQVLNQTKQNTKYLQQKGKQRQKMSHEQIQILVKQNKILCHQIQLLKNNTSKYSYDMSVQADM